jgi:hypothetical protein
VESAGVGRFVAGVPCRVDPARSLGGCVTVCGWPVVRCCVVPPGVREADEDDRASVGATGCLVSTGTLSRSPDEELKKKMAAKRTTAPTTNAIFVWVCMVRPPTRRSG